MFGDGAERVLSEMLFHADETEAVKAHPLIVAWRTLCQLVWLDQGQMSMIWSKSVCL